MTSTHQSQPSSNPNMFPIAHAGSLLHFTADHHSVKGNKPNPQYTFNLVTFGGYGLRANSRLMQVVVGGPVFSGGGGAAASGGAAAPAAAAAAKEEAKVEEEEEEEEDMGFSLFD